MNKNLELMNLINMLRELDINKNTREDIKNALDFIADKLEELVGEFNE